MRARDVMTLHVITVGPTMNVHAVANTLVKNKISAVPVVGVDCKLLGIVSEGDLIRRVEAGTENRRSWWLELFTSSNTLAAEFAKSHGQKAKDVMTRDVITASPGTRLREIANLLERHRIKRVPIVENDRLVGIVSRANLVQVLAGQKAEYFEVEPTDASMRQAILGQLENQPWAKRPINIVVQGGVVDLWGFVNNDEEKKAIRIAVEATPGVRTVNDNMDVYPPLAAVY
jgi:CBS domain-containing protein